MRSTLRAAAVLCVSLAACATSLPKFQSGAPVEVEQKPLGHAFKQDGKVVDVGSLLAGLEGLESAKADAQSARSWAAAGSVLGAAGGAAMGYGLVTGINGDSSGWAVAGVGVGVTAIAMAVGHTADGKLLRAVDAYNASRAPAPAAKGPTASLSPWIGQIRTAQDRCIAGGVTVTF